MSWVEVAPVIKVHIVAALLALAVGMVQLARAKGTPSHRWIGRFWVGVMVLVSVTTLWIQELRPGSYSWIHLLSVWTLISLAVGFWFIRRGNATVHGFWMIGTFVGGLLVAGGFAVFGANRLIPQLLGS